MDVRSFRRSHAALLAFAGIIGLWLMCVYIILPAWLGHRIARQLSTFSSYRASFSRVSISLLNASYTIHNARLTRKESVSHITFMEAEEIEFGLSSTWKKGKLSGKIFIRSPRMAFDYRPENITERNELTYPFRSVANRLLAFPLDEIVIVDGYLSFRDLQSAPRIKLEMQDISIVIRNLSGHPNLHDRLVADARGVGRVYGGKLRFSVNFNPASRIPDFAVKAQLNDLDLSYLADYLRVYGNYSIGAGIFSMQAEAIGEDESISGFVKPLLETVNFASLHERDFVNVYPVRSPFARSYPQTAFHGNLKYAALSTWSAVAFTLRNAFFEALLPVIHKIGSPETPDLRPGTLREFRRERGA